jgi:hypothetical protein
MLLKRSWKGVALNVLVIVLLALPLVAGAQTTGTGATGATSGTGSATAAQTNGITSPRDMAALSGTVEVRGFANDPNFLKWQLDLLPNNNANAAIFLAVGEKPGEFTYSFDTTRWPAGEHTLRLRVVRTNSNYDEYFTKFTLGGAAAGGQTAGATTGQTGTATGQTGAAAGQTGATTGQTTGATAGQGVTTNGLAAPSEGQNISGQFVIRGFASDPNFMKWQLDLLPGGNANQAVFLAVGEASGVFTHTLNTTNLPAGQHQLRLRVVRMDSNYNEYFTNFTIGGATTGGGASGQTTGATTGGTTAGTATGGAATSGTTGGATTGGTTGGATGGTTGGATGGQMTNGITAPREGATVSGQVQITGYANTPGFLKWQLDLLPGGNANQAAFLTFGEKAGEFTYTLDTTNLPAGEHALRLRVVRSDSNYDEYVTRFTITK